MGLDLYFCKKGINLQEIRENISNLYEKKRAIEKEIEQFEDAYKGLKLASIGITHNNLNKMYENLISFCRSVLHWCHEYPDAVIEVNS